METRQFCQSCSMPLDNPDMQGTEKDGTRSAEYCKYCYQRGAFINPGMTLSEMTSLVTSQMKKMAVDNKIIDLAVRSLPGLKRWAGRNQEAPFSSTGSLK